MNGRIEQENFNDYRVMRLIESPIIEVYIVKNAEAPGGIAEAATSALFPIAENAVAAATGKTYPQHIRKLQIDPALIKA